MRQEDEFFERLDNALRNILITRYENLYAGAQDVFHRFRSVTAAKVKSLARNCLLLGLLHRNKLMSFLKKLMRRASPFVLPKIVEDSTEIDVMEKITGWLAKEFPLDAP